MGKQFFRLVIWLTYLDLVILVMVSGSGHMYLIMIWLCHTKVSDKHDFFMICLVSG